jgi:hypothetical protein
VSDTPRTDAVTEHFYNSGVGLRSGSFVEACVARTLERDLNAEKVERVALAVELAQRTAERDEARREICELRADLRVNPTFKRQVAAERGWDCFDAPHATDGRVQNGGA